MKENKIQAFTKPLLENFLAGVLPLEWEKDAFYGDFLAQTHYHVAHSTRLLAAAAARFGVDEEKFHLQCMRHAGEERSHEVLSISDLKKLGRKIEDFPELPATKALYRNAYFLIERQSPFALFGYAYFLECVGVAGKGIEKRLIAAHGAEAVRHLTLHANEDPEHIQAYEHILNGFTGERWAILEESISSTAYHYERIYQEICSRSARGGQAKARLRLAA